MPFRPRSGIKGQDYEFDVDVSGVPVVQGQGMRGEVPDVRRFAAEAADGWLQSNTRVNRV